MRSLKHPTHDHGKSPDRKTVRHMPCNLGSTQLLYARMLTTPLCEHLWVRLPYQLMSDPCDEGTLEVRGEASCGLRPDFNAVIVTIASPQEKEDKRTTANMSTARKQQQQQQQPIHQTQQQPKQQQSEVDLCLLLEPGKGTNTSTPQQ